MNLLNNPGRWIYGALTFVSFLCALGVAYIYAWSFAIDAPNDSEEPGFILSRVIFAAIVVGVASLFLGFLGSLPLSRLFAISAIVGSAILLCLLLRYAESTIVRHAEYENWKSQLVGVLLVASVEASVLIFSVIKLRQLRVPEITASSSTIGGKWSNARG